MNDLRTLPTQVYPVTAFTAFFVVVLSYWVVTPISTTHCRPALVPDGAHASVIDSEHHVELTIESDGNVFLQCRWLPDQQLNTKLRELHAWFPHGLVSIRADSRLSYGRVRTVLRMVSEAGFHHLVLRTMPRYNPA